MESYLELLRDTLWHIGVVSQLGAGVVQGFRSLRSFVQPSAHEGCTVCKDQELADPGTVRASSVAKLLFTGLTRDETFLRAYRKFCKISGDPFVENTFSECFRTSFECF